MSVRDGLEDFLVEPMPSGALALEIPVWWTWRELWDPSRATWELRVIILPQQRHCATVDTKLAF